MLSRCGNSGRITEMPCTMPSAPWRSLALVAERTKCRSRFSWCRVGCVGGNRRHQHPAGRDIPGEFRSFAFTVGGWRHYPYPPTVGATRLVGAASQLRHISGEAGRGGKSLASFAFLVPHSHIFVRSTPRVYSEKAAAQHQMYTCRVVVREEFIYPR